MTGRPPSAPATAPAQDWDARAYAANARFVADLAGDVVRLLDPKPGERILDLGCGDGALTELVIDAGAVVTGVDASADQVAAARARGVEAQVVNGHELNFAAEFDAVFSNAALHWMQQLDCVVAGVARVLKPGGRFVGEMGGSGNVVKILAAMDDVMTRRGHPGLPGLPWAFPSPEEFGARLKSHGFVVRSMELIPRPTRLPGDIGGWLDVFCESFFRVLDPADRGAARDDIIEALRPVLADADGAWWADYVRLRFSAQLAGS